MVSHVEGVKLSPGTTSSAQVPEGAEKSKADLGQPQEGGSRYVSVGIAGTATSSSMVADRM